MTVLWQKVRGPAECRICIRLVISKMHLAMVAGLAVVAVSGTRIPDSGFREWASSVGRYCRGGIVVEFQVRGQQIPAADYPLSCGFGCP